MNLYNRRGEPMDLFEWAARMEDADYQRVDFTVIGGVEISTVWFGMDMRHRGGGLPMIFETMIFGGEYNEWRQRYATAAEAIAGHTAVAAAIAAGKEPA